MQILDAARATLLKQGFEGTTIEAIARRCELSVGTIYLYFESKEEIFAELQEEGIQMLGEMVQEAITSSKNTEKRLLAIAQAYLRFRIQKAKYFDIINHFLTSPRIIFPEHLKKRIDELGNKVLGELEKVIAQGIEKKEIFHHDSRECAIAFWGLLHGILQFSKLRGTIIGTGDYRTMYLRIARHFIESLTTSAAIESREGLLNLKKKTKR